MRIGVKNGYYCTGAELLQRVRSHILSGIDAGKFDAVLIGLRLGVGGRCGVFWEEEMAGVRWALRKLASEGVVRKCWQRGKWERI